MKILIIMDESGGIEVVTDGPAEVITVCDWVSDRLYRLSDSHTVSADRVAEIIGDDPIGSKDDDRHEALSNRILSHMDGKPHLRPVK